MAARKLKAALYARVSTREQSVEPQLLQLREYVMRAGWEYEEYTDIAISGAKRGRPGLSRLMKQIHLRKFDYLVVAAFDRYARSVSHLVQTLEELDHLGVHFISLREQINTSTSMGRVVFHIIAAVAQLERDIIRERTMQGLRAAKKRGNRVGGEFKKWDEELALKMRRNGSGIRRISKVCGVGVGTVYRMLERRGDPQQEESYE